MPQATQLTDRPVRDTWRTLGRHQVGAVAASVVDFGMMIVCVELFGLTATAGTAVGATCGALLNFSLGRTWIFRQHSGHWHGQALRYAVVSGASAGWNTLGEHFLSGMVHVQYLLARVLVALAVGLAWNFPMQRRFVFRERASA